MGIVTSGKIRRPVVAEPFVNGRLDLPTGPMRTVVIGAGQAGLSAAYFLRSHGLRPWTDFVVLDGNDGPGGAWRHRWDSLTLGRAHGIHPLPGSTFETPDPSEPANRVVPRYYGGYESEHGLPVLRPVEVEDVRAEGGRFTLTTARGSITADTIVNATGTWGSPYIPYYPGLQQFRGRQVHTHDFEDAEVFTGERVLVVGGGISALQFIQELHRHGVETVWATRSTPRWTRRAFDRKWGLDVERAVSARTTRGLPPLSVSAATGLPMNDLYVPDIRSGLLIARGRPTRFTADSVVLDGPGPHGSGVPGQGDADPLVDDASVPRLPGRNPSTAPDSTLWEVPVDAVLWATGFRAHVRHLRHLGIREPGGGILMGKDAVTVVRRPGLFMTGYGASASTLGATRAGRRAALRALRFAGETALSA